MRRRSILPILLAIFIPLIIGFIILAILAFTFYNGFKQDKAFENEMAYVNTLLEKESQDNAQIDEVLSRTVTDGQYALAEKSIKSHIKAIRDDIDLFNGKLQTAIDLTNPSIEKIVGGKSNYPGLIKEITDSQEERQKILDRLDKNISSDGLNTFMVPGMKKKGFQLYNIYKEEFLRSATDITVEGLVDQNQLCDDTLNEIINYYKFLDKTKDRWVFEDNHITFNDPDPAVSKADVDEYNAIIDKIVNR